MKRFTPIIIILLIIGGFPLVCQFLEVTGTMAFYLIFALLELVPHLPTSVFDVIEQVIEQNWTLTNIIWLDSALLHIATFAPSLIIFCLGKFGFKLPWKINGLVSLLVFLTVLQFFSSFWFWLFLGIIIIAFISLKIIFNIKTIES